MGVGPRQGIEPYRHYKGFSIRASHGEGQGVARVGAPLAAPKIVVEIEDFILPAIIERLDQQAAMLKPKIDDWRTMVDCVMIDPGYDDQVFKVVLADVPERKADFVSGKHEIPAPSGETIAVAVKIIDMLGEEVLIKSTVSPPGKESFR